MILHEIIIMYLSVESSLFPARCSNARPLPFPHPLIPHTDSSQLSSVCASFLMCVHVCLCMSQVRTRDLGGYSTTGDFVRAVVENLRHRPVY